jgi:hypothetical protein
MELLALRRRVGVGAAGIDQVPVRIAHEGGIDGRMALQHGRELAQALLVDIGARLGREDVLLAQRLPDRNDEPHAIAEEAPHGIIELAHALVDVLGLHLMDAAPAEPRQRERQGHHDQCHQCQDADAQGDGALIGHVSPPLHAGRSAGQD